MLSPYVHLHAQSKVELKVGIQKKNIFICTFEAVLSEGEGKKSLCTNGHRSYLQTLRLSKPISDFSNFALYKCVEISNFRILIQNGKVGIQQKKKKELHKIIYNFNNKCIIIIKFALPKFIQHTQLQPNKQHYYFMY